MPPTFDSATTTHFLGGAVFGLIVMTAVLSVRPLATALLTVMALALIAGVAIDGPEGFMRWLQLGIAKLLSLGPWVAGFGVGKLLAGILVTALGPMPRRPR